MKLTSALAGALGLALLAASAPTGARAADLGDGYGYGRPVPRYEDGYLRRVPPRYEDGYSRWRPHHHSRWEGRDDEPRWRHHPRPDDDGDESW